MVIRKPRLRFYERIYLVPVFKGLWITLRHLLRGLLNPERFPTLQYPDVRRLLRWNYRGKHRLTLKDDGSVKCTACMLCATACPADCIYIEAGEHPDPTVEKFPVRYEIDILRCVFCGLCVEACPCDAIRMDSGTHPGNLGFGRKEFVETKEVLMKRWGDLAEKGKEGLYEEYVKPYRHV